MKRLSLTVIVLALCAFFVAACGPAVVDTSKETHVYPGAKKKQALTAEKF